MKRMLVPTIVILAVLLISLAAQPVSAGVEPSPFQPVENEVLNLVNRLSLAHNRLENVLTSRQGEALGVLEKRTYVADEITQYLGQLAPKLEEYVAALPDAEPRGRQAGKVLEDGMFHVMGIVETIDDFLLDPGENPDREFIATLMGLRLEAEAVGVFLVDVCEVMGVEPSPFNPNAVRIDDNDWDTEGQCFVMSLSMNRGLANAGKRAGFNILITLDIVSIDDQDWDSVKLKIDDNGYDIDDDSWDKEANFAPLEPLEIPWDRNGGTFSGMVSVEASASIISPSGNAMGHETVYTSEIDVGTDEPETPPGGDNP